MKKLPLGLQSFVQLREDNCVYIDKTEHVYRLIQGYCYFFARPRRFGKSILCSTLKALFQGKKELFTDLWISQNTDYSWPIHPVIHIDFGKISVESPELFRQELIDCLYAVAKKEKLPEIEKTSLGSMLQNIMFELVQKYDNKKIVLIIDEYDRPILHHLTKPDSLEQMQEIIRNFYTCIKGLHELVKFLFVTGISRFTRTNLFSGFNQIQDISMDPRYAHLVGYTEEELDTTLSEHMVLAAKDSGKSLEEFKEETKKYYDGYRFWKNVPAGLPQVEIPRVYNPFSVMNNLANPTFEYYWFESGTPTFLMNLLKQNKYPIESFDNIQASGKELGAFEPTKLPLKTLLYQTGYLTIKEYDIEVENFTLTYPNVEVKEAFLQEVLIWIAEINENEVNTHSTRLRKALQNNNISLFVDTLKSFYATIPYNIQLDQEKYYQTIFYIILTLLGIKIDVEVITNIGRIDAVIKTNNYIYIVEFKLEKSASKALEQIKTKKYFEQYQYDLRPITLIGMTFSSQEKNISDVKIEELKKN